MRSPNESCVDDAFSTHAPSSHETAVICACAGVLVRVKGEQQGRLFVVAGLEILEQVRARMHALMSFVTAMLSLQWSVKGGVPQ